VIWVFVDVALGLLVLGGLGIVLLGVWRKVKALGSEVSRAGESIAAATDALARVQAETPAISTPGRVD
jgi:hypothetical protein